MQKLTDVKSELKYIEDNFEFSDDCPIELRNHLLGKGYVNYYDDVLMLTPMGESLIGIYTEEDEEEGFFYKDHDGEYE